MSSTSRPNVLLIVADDLNDWTSTHGGHPQAQTPHHERLARRGVTFLNAHVQAPVCTASRNSFLSGKLPSSLGSYDLRPHYDELDGVQVGDSLPEHFAANGYATLGAGKVFHGGAAKGEPFTTPWPAARPSGSVRPPFRRPPRLLNWTQPVWDWGAVEAEDEDMPDYRRALQVADFLSRPGPRPFFAAVGISMPHVPIYAPRKYFDLHPLDGLVLPESSAEDLDGLPAEGVALATHIAADPGIAALEESGKWASLVQAYLAGVTFVDACLGVILDGLDAGPQRDNTIVIVFGDNGWHLGEKRHLAKRTLWHESTRTPMIVATPGGRPGSVCRQPAGPVDLYPTLVELCGLSPRAGLDGVSLLPQLRHPDAPRREPVLSTWLAGNHAVRTEKWTYIRYRNGGEELYDARHDPDERHNLATDPRFLPVTRELAAWLPEQHAGNRTAPG
ncbi:MAG: sulfatase [Lentisphaeria bacterium]|nr:sulfatase [Lentisphaeria bacterium]